MRILIITAVEREREAIGALDNCMVVAGGIGRTNAAAATVEALLRDGPFDAVISAGVAGALPAERGAYPLAIGEAVVASSCVYCEEGLITPAGFQDMAAMGFPLGDFNGNVVPVDEKLLASLSGDFRTGTIATVATCSGTDAAAREVARRSGGALAEAMEGAAVVHAARRHGVPAIELRVISNMTGDRDRQVWDLDRALRALGTSVQRAIGLRNM